MSLLHLMHAIQIYLWFPSLPLYQRGPTLATSQHLALVGDPAEYSPLRHNAHRSPPPLDGSPLRPRIHTSLHLQRLTSDPTCYHWCGQTPRLRLAPPSFALLSNGLSFVLVSRPVSACSFICWIPGQYPGYLSPRTGPNQLPKPY